MKYFRKSVKSIALKDIYSYLKEVSLNYDDKISSIYSMLKDKDITNLNRELGLASINKKDNANNLK